MCIHVYQCFKSIFFNFNFLISPHPPPPLKSSVGMTCNPSQSNKIRQPCLTQLSHFLWAWNGDMNKWPFTSGLNKYISTKHIAPFFEWVNEMFGGEKWRWRSSTSPPPTFWLGSHSLAGNVSISWKQIDLCSSHLNHQLQMFDFNCWKYYINKTEEEEECMHSRSRDKNSFCLQKCICLSPRMHFLVKLSIDQYLVLVRYYPISKRFFPPDFTNKCLWSLI